MSSAHSVECPLTRDACIALACCAGCCLVVPCCCSVCFTSCSLLAAASSTESSTELAQLTNCIVGGGTAHTLSCYLLASRSLARTLLVSSGSSRGGHADHPSSPILPTSIVSSASRRSNDGGRGEHTTCDRRAVGRESRGCKREAGEKAGRRSRRRELLYECGCVC